MCPTFSLDPRTRDPLGFDRHIPAGGLPGIPRLRGRPLCGGGRSFVTYQCSSRLLLPPPQFSSKPPVGGGGVDVLLATSDHFGHGLFAMMQRILNQVHLARANRLEPAVFLGERTFMEPQACEYGTNSYYHAPAGDNVWEYWFEQPGNYTIGASHVRGRPVATVQVTTVEWSADAPIRSYTTRETRQRSRRAANAILGDGGRKLIKRRILQRASRLFAPWRARSRHILGVHLRGTDKVVRAKVPPGAYFPFIDAYISAHAADALVFVATDDRTYRDRLVQRYGEYNVGKGAGSGSKATGRIVGLGRGYSDATWGSNADTVFAGRQSASRSNSGYTNGLAVLFDALVLSKCDFVLMSVSAVAEFALWIAPRLWTNHLNLQVTDRFLTQPMPPWTRAMPGVSRAWTDSGRRQAVADVFCHSLAAACANETQRLYGGRFCSRCQEEAAFAGKDLDDIQEIHRWT